MAGKNQKHWNDPGTLTRDLQIDRMKMAARLLVKGANIRDTAKKIGLHYTQFYKWMKDPVWADIYRSTSEALNARLDEALAQNVTGQLKVAAEKSLQLHMRIIDDPDAPLATRARVADSLMDRDERMSKKRQLSVKHGHEILNPEILALAAATAQAMLAAQNQKVIEEPVIDAEIVDPEMREEASV